MRKVILPVVICILIMPVIGFGARDQVVEVKTSILPQKIVEKSTEPSENVPTLHLVTDASETMRSSIPMFMLAAVEKPAERDFAEGYFEVDGKKVHLTHAYVEMGEDLFNKNKKAFRVYLTDRPVSSDDWREQIKDLSYEKKLQYIEISISESKHILGVVLETPLLKMGYVSSAGGHKFEAKTFGPSVIEGSASTETREIGGQKYRYRVAFRATLMKDADKKGASPKSLKADYNNSLFDSPMNKAIEKMLLDAGDGEILRTATRIAVSDLGGFAVADVRCEQKGKETQIKAFLFKEKDQWKAYRKIPTRLDHPGMFFMLAREYCSNTWKHFNGIGYLDDSWKTKDPKKRAIHFNCGELIDNQWTDHHLKFTYAYDKKSGWCITSIDDLKKTSQKSMPSKKEETEFADDVVDRFFLSIMEGDMNTVKGFMEAGMSPNVKRPRLGHSPLFAAVLGRRDAMALMFIKAGGDANFKDENGSTPLMWAADRCKSVPLVQALIDAGADVNAKARGGGTPLVGAEVNKCMEIVKILKAAGAK